MDNIAIKVTNVSKSFKLPHEKQGSIKNAFVNVLKSNKSYEMQHVLKDIDVEIKKGEFFGIVGRNGSGKSTLLKLIAGVYTPDKGAIHVNGKLTPFIELGVGFNPELTGRENIYLNGALLGFSRGEMDEMYEEIVEFAELEKFMDQKLKNYSSGMQVRLAFSIAIRAKSDILVLDEVLAVGDEAFQKKCIDVFDKYKSNGQTIVLVTHDMGTVTKYCSRAMLVSNGKIEAIGKPSAIAAKYSLLNQDSIDKDTTKENKKHKETKLKLTVEGNKVSFKSRDTLRVKLTWPDDIKKVENAGIAIITNAGQTVFGVNTLLEKIEIGKSVTFETTLDLLPGKYNIIAGIFGKTRYDIIDFVHEGPSFIIKDPEQKNRELEGTTLLNYKWVNK